MEAKRDGSLDAVRGFAILAVMLGHCIVLNDMADGIVYDAIQAVQMPLFMAVSGWLAGSRPRFVSGKELGRQLGSRAVSLLVPFVSWIFVAEPAHFFRKFRQVLWEPDRGLWFLLTLFLLHTMLLFALFVKDGLGLGKRGFFAALFAELALLFLHYRSGVSLLGPALTVRYVPFYLGGCAAGRLLPGRAKAAAWKRRAAQGLALALFAFLIVRFDMVYAANRAQWLLQMTASALGSALCFQIVYGLREGKGKAALSSLGRYTLEIYVLHFRFANVLGLKEQHLSLYSLRGVFGVTATLLVMGFLTAFFIHVLTRLAVTDLLLFGKRNRGGRRKKRQG